MVFLFGMATWCWEPGDVVGRRLAAVQLVETGAATSVEAAAAFDVDYDTIRRWRVRWREEGVVGLEEKRTGPRGPVKVTGEKAAVISRLRAQGLSLRAIGSEVGLDASTVRRCLAGEKSAFGSGEKSVSGSDEKLVSGSDEGAGGALVPLAKPLSRDAERAAARVGLLAGAEPVICEGVSLPYGGALLVLPALAVTGLLDAFSSVYGSGRAAFYSLRSLVLSLVFCLLLGEPRAEGLTRLDPPSLGRLIGLDRAPEVKTMRSRLEELAGLAKSDELLRRLAEAHLAACRDACGLLYIDGHVRAYHGTARVQKAHLARQRLAAPASVDTWICDRRGDGVLVWCSEPGASLTSELQRACEEIRALVGGDARPTVAFDRGGWSPKLFAELSDAGFDIITYRKAPFRPEKRSSFAPYEVTGDLATTETMWLSQRTVRIAYTDDHKTKRHFSCRQVTRLDPTTGHQTQILTTRIDLTIAEVATAMFGRWREENFFRYMRHTYGLDALDSYANEDDDMTRMVPNPAKKQATSTVAAARAAQRTAEQAVADVLALTSNSAIDIDIANTRLAEATTALSQARDNVTTAKSRGRAVPAKVPLGDVHPDTKTLDPERKRLHDACRMAVYNATSSLARLLGPHYTRADDEARMLLREAFRTPADLQIIGDELHVRIDPLSAPRRSRAIAGMCHTLNDTQTLYPGTKLRLVYTVKGT